MVRMWPTKVLMEMIVLFSEIFQVTGPIRRTAALLAGHGEEMAGVHYREFKLDPAWDPLRNSPCFEKLLAELR
jgi:hypothetical protein